MKRAYGLRWGDTLYIEGCKDRYSVVVHDLTNKRYNNTVDILVPTSISYPYQLGCPDKIKVQIKKKM